jgi:hypothetical protein
MPCMQTDHKAAAARDTLGALFSYMLNEINVLPCCLYPAGPTLNSSNSMNSATAWISCLASTAWLEGKTIGCKR